MVWDWYQFFVGLTSLIVGFIGGVSLIYLKSKGP